VKLAQVRYYFDADILGLGKLLGGLRPDITYRGDPGAIVRRRERPACPVQPPADEDWIPQVAPFGWLILTRDSGIQQHRAEVDAVRTSGARMVALAGENAANTWDQLELVMSKWRKIEELLPLPGPFIYRLSLTGGLRKMGLDLPLRPGPRRKAQSVTVRTPVKSEGTLDLGEPYPPDS